MDEQITRDFVVNIDAGLHIRPISLLVQIAMKHQASVSVENLDASIKVDGKSVFAMMTLKAVKGTRIRITANGDDRQQVIDEMTTLFNEDFGE